MCTFQARITVINADKMKIEEEEEIEEIDDVHLIYI